MKTPLEKASDHCLAAVKELRGYIVSENMESDDPHLKFCTSQIRTLQRVADRCDPPHESWDAKIVPFVPRMKTGE